MSVYLGYNTVTKQYLKSLTGDDTGSSGGGSSVDTNGFTMSGDIDMDGNEIVGLDDPSNDSSAASKKYVDDYLSKTDATSTYAPIDASYMKAESDAKYSTTSSGGLSASCFTMTGDIDMSDNKIKRLSTPTVVTSATNKSCMDNNFLSKHGGLILGNIAMSGQSITNLNPTPQSNNDAVTKSYVDNSISLAGGLSISGITM